MEGKGEMDTEENLAAFGRQLSSRVSPTLFEVTSEQDRRPAIVCMIGLLRRQREKENSLRHFGSQSLPSISDRRNKNQPFKLDPPVSHCKTKNRIDLQRSVDEGVSFAKKFSSVILF